MRFGRNTAIVIVVFALALIIPFFSNNFFLRFFTTVLMFGVLASSWNIIGGYTGYASFGNVVFYGIGAYVAAVLMEKFGVSFAIALPAAGFGAALFGVLIGIPVLRLRGHYFAIATLGVAEAMKALVDNLEITEGNSGIYLPMMDMSVKSQYLFFYFSMLALLVLTLGVTFWILKSKFGYGIRAIREDEDAANMVGINTTIFKIWAFALSGLFTGLAGALAAFQQGFIKPEAVFSVEITVKMIVMAVFGGIGQLFGPLLGAATIEVISEFLSNYFLVAHTLFFGAIVILAIIFTPKGIIQLVSGEKRLNKNFFLENIREHKV